MIDIKDLKILKPKGRQSCNGRKTTQKQPKKHKKFKRNLVRVTWAFDCSYDATCKAAPDIRQLCN